jgi:hypothetical protein
LLLHVSFALRHPFEFVSFAHGAERERGPLFALHGRPLDPLLALASLTTRNATID